MKKINQEQKWNALSDREREVITRIQLGREIDSAIYFQDTVWLLQLFSDKTKIYSPLTLGQSKELNDPGYSDEIGSYIFLPPVYKAIIYQKPQSLLWFLKQVDITNQKGTELNLSRLGSYYDTQKPISESPLAYCLMKVYNSETISILLEHKADVLQLFKWNASMSGTVVEYAVFSASTEHKMPSADLLLNIINHQAFNVNEKIDDQGNSLLTYAFLYGNDEAIRILLAQNADINMQNYEGNTILFTLLHADVLNSHINKFLSTPQVDLNIKNSNGLTPFAYALNLNRFDVLDMIRKYYPAIYNQAEVENKKKAIENQKKQEEIERKKRDAERQKALQPVVKIVHLLLFGNLKCKVLVTTNDNYYGILGTSLTVILEHDSKPIFKSIAKFGFNDFGLIAINMMMKVPNDYRKLDDQWTWTNGDELLSLSTNENLNLFLGWYNLKIARVYGYNCYNIPEAVKYALDEKGISIN